MNTEDPSGNHSDDFENRLLASEVKNALGELQQTSFAEGFEDRAWERWTRERNTGPSLFTFIERRALQFLPLAIAASLILAVYSSRHNRSAFNPNASFISRTFGWSARATELASTTDMRTYESVYAAMYGLPELNSAQGAR